MRILYTYTRLILCTLRDGFGGILEGSSVAWPTCRVVACGLRLVTDGVQMGVVLYMSRCVSSRSVTRNAATRGQWWLKGRLPMVPTAAIVCYITMQGACGITIRESYCQVLFLLAFRGTHPVGHIPVYFCSASAFFNGELHTLNNVKYFIQKRETKLRHATFSTHLKL